MMYDVGNFATLYNDLCFAQNQPFNFYVYGVGTKMSFKFCAYAIETPTTSHNFWIYIKIETACKCLVVTPGFRGHQDPGANIITKCDGTKSHTYDDS
jgi:hypothetical protein